MNDRQGPPQRPDDNGNLQRARGLRRVRRFLWGTGSVALLTSMVLLMAALMGAPGSGAAPQAPGNPAPSSTSSATTSLKTISAKALTDHGCDSTEWHFVINQLASADKAPASIHVTWANGSAADVPLAKFTGGVAHYSTTANLTSTVTSATTQIYSAWGGEFNLSSGPCGTSTTTASTTSSAAVAGRSGSPAAA